MTDYRRIKRPFNRKPTRSQEFILSKHIDNPSLFSHIIGVDEVGWGACSGPLVVAAAVLPFSFVNPIVGKTKDGTQYGFKDSKRFTTEKSRKAGAKFAKEHVVDYTILFSLSQEITKYGPARSLSYLQRKVAQSMLKKYPNALVVIDGKHTVMGINKKQQLAIVKADSKVPAVSAAAIIAKVARDEYMCELGDTFFPEWEFHRNKGYLTPQHLAKLKKWGPTSIHRMNVTIVKQIYNERGYADVTEKA